MSHPPRSTSDWLLAVTAATSTTLLGLAGMVQVPNDLLGGLDLRPQLFFDVRSPRAQGAVVLLDDRDVGRAGTYIEGATALQVAAGPHHLRVDADGIIILDERFYVGDGVQRTFVVR